MDKDNLNSSKEAANNALADSEAQDKASIEEDESAGPTLRSHLSELRGRLIKVFIIWMIGFLICYQFSDYFLAFISQPLLSALPQEAHKMALVYRELPEAFFVLLKISFIASLFATAPFTFYQLWAFITPGLYPEEKVFIIPIALSSAVLFILGGVFCYYLVFPNAFSFFLSFSSGFVSVLPGMQEYFSLIMHLLIAFGLVFELPLLSFFFAKAGLITAQKLKKFRRYAIVIGFILAAILTPPDVLSQLLMAGSIIVLYEVSIIIAAVFGVKPAEKPNENTSKS